MPDTTVRVEYIGAVQNFSEVTITGNQQVWRIGSSAFVETGRASQLVASGKFRYLANDPAMLPSTQSKIGVTSSDGGIKKFAGAYVEGSVGVALSQAIARGESFAILVISDSTGATVTRWPRLLADSLAARYPSATVLFREWDDASSRWPALTVVQTGTIGRIVINSGAMSGTIPSYLQGAKWPSVISVGADALILNHGHNISASWATSDARKAELLTPVESVLSATGPIPVILVAQNPAKDRANDSKIAAVRELSAGIGAGLADVGAAFDSLGNADALYVDALHPSDAVGSPLFRDVILNAIDSEVAGPVMPGLWRRGINLISNGRFDQGSANSVPTGWTGANVSVTDVTTPGAYETGARAVDIVAATGTGQSYIQYQLSTAQLQAAVGQVCTLAVRLSVPAAAPSTAGRVSLSVSGTGAVSQTTPGLTSSRDGYKWVFATVDVIAAAASVKVIVYVDSSATPTTNTAHAVRVDRAILLPGRRPADF